MDSGAGDLDLNGKHGELLKVDEYFFASLPRVGHERSGRKSATPFPPNEPR